MSQQAVHIGEGEGGVCKQPAQKWHLTYKQTQNIYIDQFDNTRQKPAVPSPVSELVVKVIDILQNTSWSLP